MLMGRGQCKAAAVSATAWTLSNVSYDSKSFAPTSQTFSPAGISFKPDGTKMYIATITEDKIFQYSLSPAWDVSTASYDSVSFDLTVSGTYVINANGMSIGDSGTELYVADEWAQYIYQYTFSTAWDTSTLSYTGRYATGLSNVNEVFMRDNGTSMYLARVNAGEVRMYTLSTAWDVTTASSTNGTGVGSEDNFPHAIFFKNDGTKFFQIGNATSDGFQYSMSTAWNVTTKSYDSVSQDFSSYDSYIRGMFIRDDGLKLYIVGDTTNTIYQFSL